MHFTHDTEISLTGAAALVNTSPGVNEIDRLVSVADLEGYVEEWRWKVVRRQTQVDLEAVRALRPRLRRFWAGDEAEIVDLVNALLAETKALPRLVNHDDWGWHLHATPDDAPIATRMAVEAAMGMVDVVRAGELSRLRTCSAEACDHVYVDLSRNRSKRFCSTTCGNRVAAAAYRVRQAAGEP